jgi:hypothetical protein
MRSIRTPTASRAVYDGALSVTYQVGDRDEVALVETDSDRLTVVEAAHLAA